MTDAARYVKLVEWSEDDGAFVGQCPGVIGPCCHGTDEVEVYRELCEIVEEWLEMARRDGKPLPPPDGRHGCRPQDRLGLTVTPSPEYGCVHRMGRARGDRAGPFDLPELATLEGIETQR